MEVWKEVSGYEGRYEVSNLVRVRSMPFKQRYLLRTGVEAWRLTTQKTLRQQSINSGYMIVHLHLDGVREALTVHRLVAHAFLGFPSELTINHIDGNKKNNDAANLEWASYTNNHLHAVDIGLNKQAIAVIDPATGIRYGSLMQARRWTGIPLAKIKATFKRAA